MTNFHNFGQNAPKTTWVVPIDLRSVPTKFERILDILSAIFSSWKEIGIQHVKKWKDSVNLYLDVLRPQIELDIVQEYKMNLYNKF